MSGTIIITGAVTGHRSATAQTFLANGWTVGLLARRADVLEEICAGHEHAIPLPADVTERSSRRRRIRRIRRQDRSAGCPVQQRRHVRRPRPRSTKISLEDWPGRRRP